MAAGARLLTMDSVTGQPYSDPAAPTLAALRRSRARRRTVNRQWSAVIGVVACLAWTVVAWRSGPPPGLHGARLAIALTICCFLAALLTLVRLGSPFIPQPGVRPRAYVPVLALLTLSSGTLILLQPSGPGFVGPLLLVAIAGRIFPRRVGTAVLVACLAFFAVHAATGKAAWNGPTGAVGLLALVAIYAMSLFARRIRAQEEQEERLLAELEESRNAELRGAALAERQRLAREMHDVLAHSLSGLVVQLEGTRLLAATAPGDDRLPIAIDRAHQLARSGLDEARQAIGMLRDDELPGPGRLAELAAKFAADTGVPCRCTAAGTPRELAPAVRIALYRVAQEGLTNVRKHARADRVEVRLEYLPDAVTLTVQDFGPERADGESGPHKPGEPGGDPAAGYGLTGMRERAGLLGGSLDASPTPDGFRVLLRVPA
jgi:signal transduction histidine kinase